MKKSPKKNETGPWHIVPFPTHIKNRFVGQAKAYGLTAPDLLERVIKKFFENPRMLDDKEIFQ